MRTLPWTPWREAVQLREDLRSGELSLSIFVGPGPGPIPTSPPRLGVLFAEADLRPNEIQDLADGVVIPMPAVLASATKP